MVKKKGTSSILLFLKRLWEPHGHKRRGKKKSTSRVAGLTGGRIEPDECTRCGYCICCIILLLFFFGGGMLGGLMAGYDTTIPAEPDLDTAAYYQMRVSFIAGEDEEYYLADNALYIDETIIFEVVIYAITGGIPSYDIEGFYASEVGISSSNYDYRVSTLLYVEIFNEDMEFFGSDYVVSGTMDTIYIMHLEAVVYTANIAWLVNGAGNRF